MLGERDADLVTTFSKFGDLVCDRTDLGLSEGLVLGELDDALVSELVRLGDLVFDLTDGLPEGDLVCDLVPSTCLGSSLIIFGRPRPRLGESVDGVATSSLISFGRPGARFGDSATGAF